MNRILLIAMRRFIISATLAGLSFAACAKEGQNPVEPKAPSVSGNTIHFEGATSMAQRIVTAPVVAAQAVQVNMPARLSWDEDHTSRVMSPVSGRVTRIAVQVGTPVKTNQPLAYLTSAEMGSAQSEASRAKIDVSQAERVFARTQELFDAGIVPAKDLEQAQNDVARARADATRTALRLKSLDALGGTGVVDQNFVLKSPIDGFIVERNLNIGMEWRLDQQLPPLFVVSDPTFLWCWIDILERDVATLKTGKTVIIHASAWPHEIFSATVDYISDAVDPVSRTVKVRAHLRNEKRLLKVDMYATAEVTRSPTGAFDIPATSVFLSEGAQNVFVKTGPFTFTKKTIRPFPSGEGRLSVSEGLTQDEQVVVDGSLYLQQILSTAEKPKG